MIAYVKTNDEGRVIASTTDEQFSAGMQQVVVDNDFDFLKQQDYVLKDGALVYDGKHEQEQQQAQVEQQAAQVMAEQMSAAAVMYVRASAATLSDDEAVAVSLLFKEWSGDGVSYAADEIVQHNGGIYRVEQAHTSQESWAPDVSPSLFSRIDVAGDGVEVWTQPTGAHNAYNAGDKVHYPAKESPIYVSNIDGNVWSPDAYPAGWQLEGEQGDTDPGEPGTGDPGTGGEGEQPETGGAPDWVQPTGAHNAYNTGDRVTYNGSVYESLIDGNTWAPDAYPQGWQLIEA